MPALTEPRAADEARMPPPGTPATMRGLFRRVFLVNVAVLLASSAFLVLSPVTVSAPIVATEVAVLGVGLLTALVLNALLLRASLRPLDGLTALMERVDLLRPGERLEATGTGDVAHLIRTFNGMLDRLETERGASAARALAAQEGERQRIARELHDEIGQSLTAVLLALKRAADSAPDPLRDDLGAVTETVRASLDEVRQVARRLRPGVLDDLGLVSAIDALAADVVEASGVAVTVEVDPRLPRLGADAELVVYRIAQESLTNVARHAGAQAVDLSLLHEGDAVVLRVLDDGRGIGDGVEGAGIRGMRERALLVGAELAVGPLPGGGTEVRLRVPRRGDGAWEGNSGPGSRACAPGGS
jgi:two-component system, NarL family, sensor histidine kinase UhpB